MNSTEQKNGQVTSKVNEVSAAIEDLEKAVNLSEERLTPVLNHHLVSKEEDSQQPKEELVPLASLLRKCAGDIRVLSARLNEIRHRIEL